MPRAQNPQKIHWQLEIIFQKNSNILNSLVGILSKVKILNLILILFSIYHAGCRITTESERDPSKKGYLLAEQMIQKGRYHDGILLHKINADFFFSYSYAKKSKERIEELNALLKISTKGRAPLEITKKEITKKENKLFLIFSIANNTEKKIAKTIFEIMIFNNAGRLLRKNLRNYYSLLETYTKPIGGWDIRDVLISLAGFAGAERAEIKIREAFFEDSSPVELKK
jgi:hypothetical protein